MKTLITPDVDKRVRQLRKDLQAARDESIRTRVHTDEQHFFTAIAKLLNADAVKLGLTNLEICQRNSQLLDISKSVINAAKKNGYIDHVGGGFGLDSEFHTCQRPASELQVGDLLTTGNYLEEVTAIKLNAKTVRVQTSTGSNNLLPLYLSLTRLRRVEERGEAYLQIRAVR